MDANLLLNIVAGLAALDAAACVIYDLYMLKKYSDEPCEKFAIDCFPFSMLVEIALLLILLFGCYVKYINNHDYFLYLMLVIGGTMFIADMIADRVEFLIDEYK